MFDKKVFKCELLSVTPDIVVYNDKSMRKNIIDADTMVVANILVQKTIRPDYMREIITNKLIPTYQIVKFETNTANNGMIVHDAPKSPIFIKYNKTVGNNGLIFETDLVPATIDELNDYAFSHIDAESYANIIYELFNKAEEYYRNSEEKGLISEDTQIKRMIKAIKRCNKI
jgi:hypothetical protein